MKNKMTISEYDEMYNVVGVALEVYNTLGRGLLEAVYQEAMELEFASRNIKVFGQYPINLWYKNQRMEKSFLADFYLNGLIIEIKSVEALCPEHRSQLFNYMRLCKASRGMLINFGERSLRCERYLYQQETDSFVLLNQRNYKDYIEKSEGQEELEKGK